MNPLVYFTFLCFFYLTPAVGQVWQWAIGIGGPYCDAYSGRMTVDNSGNIYITGMAYGPCSASGASLTNQGYGVLVAKYNSAGALIWIQCAPSGFQYCEGKGIKVDNSGNVYITGRFEDSTITFGSIVLTNNSTFASDAFVAKYNSSGQVLWAKNIGGTGDEFGEDLVLDAANNIYVLGSSSSVSFSLNNATFNNTDNTGQTSDFFVLKCNNSGVGNWVRKNSTGYGDEGGNSICMDGNSVLHITGSFSSPSIQIGNTNLINTDLAGNSADIFIGLLNANGVWLNSTSAGGIGNDYSKSVCVDPSNNTYVTGYFQSPTMAFGTHTLSTVSMNVFVAKYQSNLSVVWVKGANSNSHTKGTDIIYNMNGEIQVTGRVQSSTATFGNSTLSNTSMFMSCYNQSGVETWAMPLGTGGYVSQGIMGPSIAVDLAGTIYSSGTYTPPFSIGPLSAQQYSTSTGVYIAKLGTLTELAEESQFPSILLSPNPFSEELNIDFTENQTLTRISLYDVLGKEIKTVTLTGSKINISREGIPNGVYYLVIQSQKNNLKQIKKVIVR